VPQLARENLPLEGKFGGQPAFDLGGAIQEKAMEPWKGTPKPAMTATKPAMTATKPAMTGTKPSTSSAKLAGGSCCQPSSTAKKPTTKK
jgi:hypothetical protein